MLLSPRKNGLTSLFKEVRVFKVLGILGPEPGDSRKWSFGSQSLEQYTKRYSWATPKPNHNKSSHPHVLSWAILLSEGCRGISEQFRARSRQDQGLVAHDCGYPLSRYTCRATRVAADFLDFIAFCRCSTGVALHPLKILVSHLSPPPVPGGVAPKFGSEKVSRYTGVSQLQLRVSRSTLQLSNRDPLF